MICDSRFANCKYFYNIMKKHNGMRPQDILIILKILSSSKVSNAWNEVKEDAEVYSLKQFVLIPDNNKSIASSLQISEAEVSESLRRSEYSGLISDAKVKKVNKRAFMEFILYGIKYVFPTKPGALVRGFPTAHSASPLKNSIISEEAFVWEHSEGTQRGQIIEPLYHTVPIITQNDKNLYELLALVDAIRTGSARIINLASQELEKRILDSW